MQFTKEQLEFQQSVRKWAKDAAPRFRQEMNECWKESSYTWSLHKEVAEKGWIGAVVPCEYNGMGKGAVEYCMLNEELSAVDLSPVNHIQTQICKTILALGNETQKKRYLPKIAIGEYIGALAISEPDAGSSLKRLATIATSKGNGYEINGFKTHINLAGEAKVMAVLTKTNAGLTWFLVDTENPGITCTKLDPNCWRELPVYSVKFSNCRVKEKQMLGKEGEGLKGFFKCFNLSRLGNVSHVLGMLRFVYEKSVEHIKRREIGNNLLRDFQGIRWYVAEWAYKLEAATLMRDKAAWLADKGVEHSMESSMAKVFVPEVAEEIVSEVIRVMGGVSCYRTQPFMKILQNILMYKITAGSQEVLKDYMAKKLLG